MRNALIGLFAVQQPGQALHAAANGAQVAVAQQGRGSHGAGGHARRRVEFVGQGAGVLRACFNAATLQLARPDALANRGRRLAQFDGEHHAPKDGAVDIVCLVDGPKRGRGVFFEQAIHEQARRRTAAPARFEKAKKAERRGRSLTQQVVHFVEQEHGAGIPPQQALPELEVRQTLAARRLVADLVRLAHAEQRNAQAGRQGAGELRLAGAGWPVKQHVDAFGALAQGAAHYALHVGALLSQMVEVLPFQLGLRGRAQQQRKRIGFFIGCRAQAAQARSYGHVAIVVHRQQAGAGQRRVGGAAGQQGVWRNAEQLRERGVLQTRAATSAEPGGPRAVHIVQQRLQRRLGLVAQQQFHNLQVRVVKARNPRQSLQPQRRGVGPDRSRCVAGPAQFRAQALPGLPAAFALILRHLHCAG